MERGKGTEGGSGGFILNRFQLGFQPSPEMMMMRERESEGAVIDYTILRETGVNG